jgi:hypothetical protein
VHEKSASAATIEIGVKLVFIILSKDNITKGSHPLGAEL